MADINQLNGQVRSLEREISKLRMEAVAEADRIAQESRLKYQKLKSECEQMLVSDREATGVKYQGLLNDAVKDIRNEAEEKLKETEQRYNVLKMRLDEELRKQREETERIGNIQRDFQKEYEEMIERARKQADAQIGEAKRLLSDYDGTEPYEWFPPNNRNLFYSHLETAVQCYDSGIYQAAIGIADSLILSLEIERNRIDHMLDKWIKNYLAMKTIVNSEKKLILEDSRGIDWMSDELQTEWELTDLLPDEIIGQWINGEYFNYVKAFEETSGDGVLDFDITEATDGSKMRLKQLMRASKYSGSSAENMYSKAAAVSVRLAYESKYLCAMRSRMACYDERCVIKAQLDELFGSLDFVNTVNRFENDDAREMLILTYENTYKDGFAYLFIIPVFSELNNKWYNNIGYSFDIGDRGIRGQITERLNSEFVNSHSLLEESGGGLTQEQIAGRLRQKFVSAVNGHI